MKAYEWESFFKSFIIFFTLLEILLSINFLYEYRLKKIDIEEKIHIEMKLCAYTTSCEKLSVDFIDKSKDTEENILYKDNDFYAYFKVPTAEKYLMKVTYPQYKYLPRIEALKNKLYIKFLFYSIFSLLISILFSFYALMPLRKALQLNEEFVKDVLHDFNTPISSMVINLKIFKKEIGENKKIKRLETNIQSILSLQENLHIFLKGIDTQNEKFSLNEVIESRIQYFEILYPDIIYSVSMAKTILSTNKNAFIRIIDNLMSNASKYNISNGHVNIELVDDDLSISDTGKGIKNPSKVFKRYYKEQDRGIGIGLDIVKKLCDELKIIISIKSKEKKGTKVILNLSNISL